MPGTILIGTPWNKVLTRYVFWWPDHQTPMCVCVCVRGGGFPDPQQAILEHQRSVLHFHSIPALTTYRWPGLLPVLLTDWLQILTQPGSSSGLINLLEWLRALRKQFTYKITSLSQKDLTREQPDRRDAPGRTWGKGAGGSRLSHLHAFTNPGAGCTLAFRVFMEASSHGHSSYPLPGGPGVGLKVPTF